NRSSRKFLDERARLTARHATTLQRQPSRASRHAQQEGKPQMSGPAASQPVREILSREGVALPMLTRSDLADIPISPADVIAAVRSAYLRLAEGSSVAPAKIMMRSPHRDSVAYAMPGYDGRLQVTAFKDYYMQNAQGKK